jgi:hypothetical protein
MAATNKTIGDQGAIQKFLKPEPKSLTDEAVERELESVRTKFNFSDADLKRLRRPRRRRVI